MHMQLGGEQVEQADPIKFDKAAFHLRHPPLRLPQGGGEVGLGHPETEPCTPCATADLLGFFQHQ